MNEDTLARIETLKKTERDYRIALKRDQEALDRLWAHQKFLREEIDRMEKERFELEASLKEVIKLPPANPGKRKNERRNKMADALKLAKSMSKEQREILVAHLGRIIG